MTKRKIFQILFALSGIIPLLGGINPLLTYSFFVLGFFLRSRLIPIVKAIPFSPSLKFVGLTIFISLFTLELFSWVSEYLEGNEEVALLHPQLIPDMLLAFGFYSGIALAWFVLLRFFRFSLLQVFMTQGIYGVVIEQDGALFLQGLTSMPAGFYWWLYVALGYASPLAIAYMLTQNSDGNQQKRSHWIKFLVAIILLYMCTKLTFALWALLLQGIGFIPEPKSILEYPLW